jgi:isopenicillin-N N-acyltransferase-like protein
MLSLVLMVVVWVIWGLDPKVPHIKDRSAETWQRELIDSNTYRVGRCWLHHSPSGLWEEYLEGTGYERGVAESKLCRELQYTQEEAFVEQLQGMIPSRNYLRMLGYLARIFNRNLQNNITDEYKEEIYGESLFAPHDFDYVSTPYDRLLNYHAAHDLSHVFQGLAQAGCTSFAAWGGRTTDSLLLIGRNFDFYAGDKFAKNKIVLFCKPAAGRKFVMITWANFIGCASGMNDAGLTITINSTESDMPTGSATPISLLAREILQYATTIDEAYAIARRRKTFVSESLLIGSALDHRAVCIEKSPSRIAIYDPHSDVLMSTNHFLSDTFKNDPVNIKNRTTTSSGYRYEHLEELIGHEQVMDEHTFAKILRDQRGKGGSDIGMCNEKAINQLIAHHSVIFQPERRCFWISTDAFMLGEYVCYDFDSVFARTSIVTDHHQLQNASLTIAADTFLHTRDWNMFQIYHKGEKEIISETRLRYDPDTPIHPWESLIGLNPQYWYPYYLVGEYYRSRKMDKRALPFYLQALTKEINDSVDVYNIKEIIHKIEREGL